MNSWLFGNVPDAGKDWRQKEKREAEDKMTIWHHWNNGHGLGQSSGDGEGQEGQALKHMGSQSDMTGRLNKNNSAYKLNKQGDSVQAWHTPFPILNQSAVLCKVLIVASWPAYRFLRRQIRWFAIPTSLRIFQFVVIHRVKAFCIVNETEVDVFLEFTYK